MADDLGRKAVAGVDDGLHAEAESRDVALEKTLNIASIPELDVMPDDLVVPVLL